MVSFTEFWFLLKETLTAFFNDKVPRLGAALAFYTTFSIAPLLVIIIAITGFVFGEEAVRGELSRRIQDLIGSDGAKAIETMLKHIHKPSSGKFATIAGLATLLLGASGVFGQLHDSLNTIWRAKPRHKRSIINILRQRFFSFAMVFGIAFLLMVFLFVNAGLSALSKLLSTTLPTTVLGSIIHQIDLPGSLSVWQVFNFSISLFVISALFSMMYKLVPDETISWRDVWLGAFITAFLFNIGNFLMGFYIGNSGIASAYGAAGSLVVLLVWIYYSAQIVFFGAEFTRIYAKTYGSHRK
ncbi:MAG: YihY/virulence factor BrkB family protein [Bacteriovoracia bacterium]